ncbi:aldo-keto reductase family 1 member C23-like protein [Ctenodactylus gundi]
MEKCKEAGLAKSIGVSNFNRRQLEMILNKPGLKYKPVCNQTSYDLTPFYLVCLQVECHVYLNQSKLLDFCKSKDIVLVAYCALGTSRDKRWVDPSSPVLLEDPVLCAMAKKYKRTEALIALRYQVQRGVVVLARSFNEKRIKENMQVFEFQLTSEDMKILDGLNRNFRYNIANYKTVHIEVCRERGLLCELRSTVGVSAPVSRPPDETGKMERRLSRTAENQD